MKIKRLTLISIIAVIMLLILSNKAYAVEQTEFSIIINKVDEEYNNIEGGMFQVKQGTDTIGISTAGDGIFQTEKISITSENQELVFDIEEVAAPPGYLKLNQSFKLRVKTGLNYEKTAYIIYEATLEDADGNEFTGAEVICEKETDIIVITVPNERIKIFDLALRKFITAVNDDEVNIRIPAPTLNSNGDIEYVHDKTPKYVANNDIVTYTIRVYNEGTEYGYAMEISDDIPDGLVFLPNHQINQTYNWKMYDTNGEETTDPTKAVEIRTRYLENELLKPYDSANGISQIEPYNPDYKEVKVAFQVTEENITQEDRIITNKAQITEDKAVDEEGNELDIDDKDSTPNVWNEGEDDQDTEKIYVKKFDLALLKWVTKTIVTVDGKTTITETGFTPYDDPEPIAKVAIDKKKIDQTTVKFVYNIIIMNQGEIAGYATEITDYIPAGLKFIEADNPDWTLVGNKITTNKLEDTLLQPGESATVEVILTWENGEDNLGLKTNIAEISKDYNEHGSPDIDSDPDNVNPEDYDKQQEDDDDKADVILELRTGGTISYMWLGVTVLLILTGGIILIKKFII